MCSFFLFSNPTPDNALGINWRPYSENKEYLRIEQPLSMGKGDEKERLEFWSQLYNDAGFHEPNKSKL